MGTEDDEGRLTRMLRATRNVSRIINRAEDERTLLQDVCDALVETRGYAYAWVAVGVDGQDETTFGFAGTGTKENIEWLRRHLAAGNLPTCAEHARAAGALHITRDPPAECTLCPLREPAREKGLSALSSPLLHDGSRFGTITASLPRAMADDPEEMALFAELARDLSFGIFSLRVQRRVAESEHQFRLLAENLPGMVYLCNNDPSWSMLYMNDSGTRVTGYPPDDFYGGSVNLADLIHPEDRDHVFREVQDAVRRREPFHFVYRLTRSDGSIRWVEEFGDAVRDEQGHAAYLEGFIADVTERVEHERRIARLLEEKDLLLREVYHRVKNNMLTVASLLSLQEGHAVPECTDALEEARTRVVGMVELYEQLHRSSDVAVVDIGTYLTRAAEELVAAHRRSSDLVLVPSLEHLELDTQTAFRLGLVFTELLTNALKYAFEPGAGGTISVGFRRSADGDAVLTVEDDGRGISGAEEGFGLTLVQELVEQMGGRFYLESDGGTRARVVIPLEGQRRA
ncbi:MAG: PAS domain-containing protein [Spirochaetaceae bacterium]